MGDRRDRPERFWETWLRQWRVRRCHAHDLTEPGIMRYGSEPWTSDPDEEIEERWAVCRRCPYLDIRIWVNGTEVH